MGLNTSGAIGQILAASYPAVLNASRSPENQWAESACMREFERQGFIDRVSLGPTIELTLDWRRNPGAGFQATDLDTASLAKTDVIAAASYSVAEISVPIVWSKKDEAINSSENQKIALVKSLLTNGIDSHDDLLEEALFAAAASNGFLSIPVIVPTSGQGVVGGIDASLDAMWRNPAVDSTFASNTIEADFTTAWNQVSKGSGSGLSPKLMVSGSASHATFEGSQQSNQRYVDSTELNAGFKVLAFKTTRYIFSQYGGAAVYMLNPKSLSLKVSKQFFRDKGDTLELESANGYVTKIYSALQLVTNNKSRCGVIY